MSYDLMVFEASAAPREYATFIKWYEDQAEWAEPHSYDDPEVASPALRHWYAGMIESYPPMNGPNAVEDEDVDNPKVTDYSVGSVVIYAAFAWSVAEDALGDVQRLAEQHAVGLFDVSDPNGGRVEFPDGTVLKPAKKPWWKLW